jgi:hypothetical protein
MTRSSLTEETSNTPGWVEMGIDKAFAGVSLDEAGRKAKDDYASCLAGCRGGVDVDAGHDRCRRTLLSALGDVDGLEQRLMALEAEISAGT